MFHLKGKENDVLVILHGGCGPQDPKGNNIEKSTVSLTEISKKAIAMYKDGKALADIATFCIQEMEKDKKFNAGIGSALQSDGMARLSAALMDGAKQQFSGVICAKYIHHPSILAKELQNRTARVLTSPGTELLAREMNIPVESYLTKKRSEKWLQTLQQNYFDMYANDTVGCLIKDSNNNLIAASSTGGRGFEYPGRVSDSATVAGTYASKYAAIAVTGHGEQITDDAVAARIETRVRDGMDLHEACDKCLNEASAHERKYGWIALDASGAWSVCKTTEFMTFVVANQNEIIDSSYK